MLFMYGEPKVQRVTGIDKACPFYSALYLVLVDSMGIARAGKITLPRSNEVYMYAFVALATSNLDINGCLLKFVA